MPKKNRNEKQPKQAAHNWLFSACHFQKHPSDPPLTRTVRSKRLEDVQSIRAVDFNHCGPLDLSPRRDDEMDIIRPVGSYHYGPLDNSPRLTELPRGSVSGSDRFFIPDADVASQSLIEEARLSNARSVGTNSTISAYPVTTYSEDPREDFRNSMAEMVRSCHVEAGEPLDWEMLEELLFAYLEVNEKEAYRYIYAAFADLIVELSQRRSAECNCHCKRRHSFG
ncbi:hypothetical protein LUZ60_009624 [Juncus effusus]|nr:hypothetical protein LUZ60_009624 [Juncus effusus]